MNRWYIPTEISDKKFGYKVKIDSHLHSSHRVSEPFGDWGESWSNTFVSIHRKSSDEDYVDVLSDFDFKLGDEVYLVWVEYSHGDSFGRSDYGGVESVWVFKTAEAAYELKEHLEATATAEYPFKGERIEYKSKDGQNIYVYYGTWTGYFEHLEAVHIEKTWMQG